VEGVGILLKNIRDQVREREAFAKAHPEAPIPKKSRNAGRPSKISPGAIRELKKRLARYPCIAEGWKHYPLLVYICPFDVLLKNLKHFFKIHNLRFF
jgi:hypothetical protein